VAVADPRSATLEELMWRVLEDCAARSVRRGRSLDFTTACRGGLTDQLEGFAGPSSGKSGCGVLSTFFPT